MQDAKRFIQITISARDRQRFDLSIRDNLCLEKDIPDEKIMQLLDEAGLMGWYKELPNGLETLVGEKGIKLSEEKITNMIEKYLKDKTYVIVTHRPRIKALCNKHYKFEQHMMKEIIDVQEKMIMYEKLDVYDENRNKTGRIIERKEEEIL